MKSRVHPTKAQKQIIRDEVNRHFREDMLRTEADMDASILWVLHEHFGFGKKRLREFYDKFTEEHKRLAEWYEMPHDTPFICRRKLLDIGVDVAAWNQEDEK